MKVFHGIDRLPAFRHPAATVGSFDGVHGGHSELLAAVRRFARERDGESIVVTFSPHPRIVLETQTDLRLLTTLDEKAWLLERAGIDNWSSSLLPANSAGRVPPISSAAT